MNAITIAITPLAHGMDLPLPSYATLGSAGMDMMAAIDAPLTLTSGERALIPTGIAIALPIGYEAQVRPRSGLALKHGITTLNSPGTIDADYRGEISIILINHGRDDVIIERGMRIAQLVIASVMQGVWQVVSSLDETQRGASGFGSTGTAI